MRHRMRARRRFFDFDGHESGHRNGQGEEAPTSSEDAKVTEEIQPAPLVSPAVISEDGEDADGLLDTFSLEGGSPRLSLASPPSIRDDLEPETCDESSRHPAAASVTFRDDVAFHEISPLHADERGPAQPPVVDPPSYEEIRGELIEKKELLADVMSQHGEYENIIGKMALKQNQRLAEMKAAHEQECKLLVDIVTDIEKSCGDRLDDMKRQHERALLAEAEELGQKLARTENAFDLYVVNLKSNHEKHISELREELLNQEKEIEKLRESQASFGAKLEAAQKEQERSPQSNDDQPLSEGEMKPNQNLSMKEVQAATEKSLDEIRINHNAAEKLIRKASIVEDEMSQCKANHPSPDEQGSSLPMTSRREKELHAKYGSFISELHMVHRDECRTLEEKLSEQERQLKQLNITKKAMEQKSTDDFQAAMATIVADYNKLIADANAANKDALRELNNQLIQRVEQIEELEEKNADQEVVIEETRRDLKEAVMKIEDNARDHKSEATALSDVISKLHVVHTEECDSLRDELSKKDEEVAKLTKEKACLETSLKAMTKTLEAIAGTSVQEHFSDAPLDRSSI